MTYDLYLPKAYADRASECFPVLFISGPGGKPGFQGLEAWAERQEVVLVTINDSKNGKWPPIIAAQQAVGATVFANLRLHHGLRFSTGFSGAAWASAILAERYGDDWAGILFCGNSQRGTSMKKFVACAYITGLKDAVYPPDNVRRDYQAAKGAGNPSRIAELPAMGHENPPIADRVAMLDWMLELERLTHPRLSADEVKAGMARVHQQVEALATEGDAAQRAEIADGLLTVEVVAKSKDGLALKALWCAALVAQAEAAGDVVQQARLYETLSLSDRVAAMPTADRKTVQAALAKLRKDKAVKADYVSRVALAKVAATEAKASGSPTKLRAIANDYLAIATSWPDTEAGKTAAVAAERLRKK